MSQNLPKRSLRNFLSSSRHHYLPIPRGPCSSKSRFFLAYWWYISTVSTLISPSGRDPCGGNYPPPSCEFRTCLQICKSAGLQVCRSAICKSAVCVCRTPLLVTSFEYSCFKKPIWYNIANRYRTSKIYSLYMINPSLIVKNNFQYPV